MAPSALILALAALCAAAEAEAQSVPGSGQPPGAARGQQEWHTLEGRVTSARTGQPLRYVTVELPGIGRSTVSDVEGRFRIERVPGGDHTLVARVLGYSEYRAQAAVPDSLAAELQLNEDAVLLQGLTVTSSRFHRRSRAYTGSVRALDNDDIKRSGWGDVRGIVRGNGVATVSCARYDECVRVGGGVVRPSVYVDDHKMVEGLGALASISREEVARIEVVDRGRMIFVYTEEFLRWAARHGYRPLPYRFYFMR